MHQVIYATDLISKAAARTNCQATRRRQKEKEFKKQTLESYQISSQQRRNSVKAEHQERFDQTLLNDAHSWKQPIKPA